MTDEEEYDLDLALYEFGVNDVSELSNEEYYFLFGI